MNNGNPAPDQGLAARVMDILRYPVKGLSGQRLGRVTLTAGEPLPFDRAFAIENGPSGFDAAAPGYLPKQRFLMLMRDEALAGLQTEFDETTANLTLRKDGAMLARGALSTAAGQAAIVEALAALPGLNLRGPLKVLAAPGHSFSDVAAKCIHIVNLGSVRAVSSIAGQSLDPIRFRPNLIIDGLPAWSELGLVGQSLQIGAVKLKVFKRTVRCAATNVNPATAWRDLDIPNLLRGSLAHSDFGIYARVVTAGDIAVGDAVRITA